jgi:hypothetical protein
MTTDERIAQAKKGKAFQGKNELIRHYQGKRLTLSQAIKAYCYDCSGYYDGGAEECGVAHCPLHPYAPYSTSKAPKRLLSEASKAKMRGRAITRKIEGSEATLPGLEKQANRR